MAISWITRKINGFFLLQEGFHHLFCHEFSLILKSKWRDLNSRLGGCGICALKIYFSIFLENIEGKKTEVTLNLIMRFNLRLGGYSIWSASTSRTIYDQDLGLEHLTASEQPRVLGGLLDALEGRLRSKKKDVLTIWSTRRRRPSTRCLQDSATKSSGACQTRDNGTAYRHRMF